MPFCVVDLFEIGIIGNGFYSFLLGNNLIVSSHHHNGAELQSFSKVHGGYRGFPMRSLNLVVEDLERKLSSLCG